MTMRGVPVDQLQRSVEADAEKYKAGLITRGVELGVSPDFVQEAIETGSLVGVTWHPHGSQNILEIYGGAITFDRTSWLTGDSAAAQWYLPKIDGYRAYLAEDGSLIHITGLHPTFTGIELGGAFLMTQPDAAARGLLIGGEGEQHLVMTRAGLQSLHSDSAGMDQALDYIEQQLFPPEELAETA